MRIDAQELRGLGERILHVHGVEPACASIQIDWLLEAQMRGYASHGMLRLHRIAERIETGATAQMPPVGKNGEAPPSCSSMGTAGSVRWWQ